MKRLMTAIGLVVALTLAGANATVGNAQDKSLTPQQERMKACNTEAKTKNLAGDARKSFMKAS